MTDHMSALVARNLELKGRLSAELGGDVECAAGMEKERE
jgi:hypothetical protein